MGCCSCSDENLKTTIVFYDSNNNKHNRPIKKNDESNSNYSIEYKYPTQSSLNMINERLTKNTIRKTKKIEINYNDPELIYQEEGIINSLIRTNKI